MYIGQLTAWCGALAEEADHGLAALLEDLGGVHYDGVIEWCRG